MGSAGGRGSAEDVREGCLSFMIRSVSILIRARSASSLRIICHLSSLTTISGVLVDSVTLEEQQHHSTAPRATTPASKFEVRTALIPFCRRRRIPVAGRPSLVREVVEYTKLELGVGLLNGVGRRLGRRFCNLNVSGC